MIDLYYIALVLPEEQNLRVLAWKNFFLERYGCQVALKSPAHITMIPPFRMPSTLEESLTQDLDQFARPIPSFWLSTSGFSAFPPRTLFASLESCPELIQLKEGIDQFFLFRTSYGVKIDRRPFHPHITVANRDLGEQDFAEAWALLQMEQFYLRWLSRSISLLRLRKKNWEVMHTSQFSAGNPD